jgi:hypothetical protein
VICFLLLSLGTIKDRENVTITLADTAPSHRDAQKEVQNIALDNNFAIPGDPGFPLNQVRA